MLYACHPPLYHCRSQQGFSLLELVLVMIIMGVMASVSLSFLDQKDSTQRYQQSIEKLRAVKRNFLAVDKFQGQTILSGFVVDNGLIEDIKTSLELILGQPPESTNKDLSIKDYRKFSFSDVYVALNNSKIQITNAGLYKGARPGLFDLSAYRDNEQKIKDGWGDDYTVENDSITIDSSGKAYKTTAAKNFTIHFNNDELQIPVSTLNITASNLPAGESQYKLAIVSFLNSGDCNKEIKSCWSTINSQTITANPNGATKFTFPDPNETETETETETEAETVTVGSHVVVLLEQDKNNNWQIFTDKAPVFNYIHLLPGITPPPITLTVPAS